MLLNGTNSIGLKKVAEPAFCWVSFGGRVELVEAAGLTHLQNHYFLQCVFTDLTETESVFSDWTAEDQTDVRWNCKLAGCFFLEKPTKSEWELMRKKIRKLIWSRSSWFWPTADHHLVNSDSLKLPASYRSVSGSRYWSGPDRIWIPGSWWSIGCRYFISVSADVIK